MVNLCLDCLPLFGILALYRVGCTELFFLVQRETKHCVKFCCDFAF